MKKIAIGISVLIILLLGMLFVVPSLVPGEVYKSRLQSQLSTELGREVVMDDDVRLSTFPLIKARTGSVRVANPDGFASEDFIALGGLEARIKLLPLFRKQVEVSRFTLIRPVIELERRADGAVNWALGETDSETPDPGPFRRDGRYTDIDPQISAFNIEDGTLRYRDAAADSVIEIGAINAFLSMPGLDSELTIDGSATVDGEPLDLDLTLASPADFLNGQETALAIDVSFDGASIDASGVIPASSEPGFAGTIDGRVSDVAALARWLPDLGENARYVGALRTAEFDGVVDIVSGRFAVSDASVALNGPALDGDFKGSAAFADGLTLDGRLAASISDVPALAALLPEPIEGLDMVRTADVTATLQALDGGTGFAIRDADARATGTGFNASFQGGGTYNEDVALQGTFSAEVSEPQRLAARFAPDFEREAAIAGAVEARGMLDYTSAGMRVTDLVATTQSPLQSSRYTGAAIYDETLSLDGTVTSDIPDATALNSALSKPIEGLDVLGAANLKARLSGALETLSVNEIAAQVTGGAVNGQYDGSVQLGDVPTLNGRFTADIPSLAALDALLPQAIPYSDAIGRLGATGTVSGSPDQLSISGLDAAMTDGQLNGSYAGPIRYAHGVVKLDGALDVSGPSLRALAARGGTVLPPSSTSGAVFENFGLSGTVTGDTKALSLSNAKISLDQLAAAGQFGVDLAGEKPKLTGTITTPELDLRPYMAAYSAQNPTGEIQPWSTQPIPAESLRGFDAALAMTTNSVKLTRMSLGRTALDVTIANGRMTADVPSLALYGGTGRGTFVLDGAGELPRVDVTASLGALDGQGFLGALAGFAQTTGTAGTQISMSGSGRSQADIMRSLSGTGDFKVKDGAIQGIDAGEFLTGLDTVISTRRLPGGIGPGKITDFRDLLGAFRIKDGVATIDRFSLDALGVSAVGEGKVDLGGQSLDFRFRPRVTGEQARGLAAFGVPIRFSGGFGAASPSLDTEFLSQIAAERARQEAGNAIRKGIGGKAGDIIGGIIGGTTDGTPAPDTPVGTTAGNPAPASAPTEDVGRTIIDGLFGGGTGSESQEPATEPEPAAAPAELDDTDEEKPESIEDAVLDIFGLGTKKDKN